jgi:hypothetical protein
MSVPVNIVRITTKGAPVAIVDMAGKGWRQSRLSVKPNISDQTLLARYGG